MICPQCGTEYRKGFKVCADCKVELIDEQPSPYVGIYSGEEDKLSEVIVNGKKMTCPVCGGIEFWTTKFMLNTRMRTFFNWDWIDRTATNKVCGSCGYVFWFLKGKSV